MPLGNTLRGTKEEDWRSFGCTYPPSVPNEESFTECGLDFISDEYKVVFVFSTFGSITGLVA